MSIAAEATSGASGSSDARPNGRDAVMQALIEATIELVVEKGLAISVREIAGRADVNHGLVHTYFGTKDALIAAAFKEIHDRARSAQDPAGFPPPDLAGRRGGELAKALARAILEASGTDPFPEHGITSAWRSALRQSRPDLDAEEVDVRVITAASLALGYALFDDHLIRSVDPACGKNRVDTYVAETVAHLGGIPGSPASAAERPQAVRVDFILRP